MDAAENKSCWEIELLTVLEKEKDLLNELEICARSKSEALASGNVDVINMIITKEQPLVLQMQSAEKQRAAVLRKNMLTNLTLTELTEKAGEDYQEALKSERRELSNAAKRLQKRNNLNETLTHSRLEFYGKLRMLLAKPMYTRTAAAYEQQQVMSSQLDKKF